LVKENAELRTQIEALERARNRAIENMKSVDLKKFALLEEAEARHQQTISSLEKELEEREATMSEELR
jgi:predicted DNA binding CopG/RHH family protein